ncbi:MAG TPA: phage baseplate assembly protein V [Caulobacteraceae bacterium]|nr:phage baseplate assembly protein V [Caulobacteraceae bacterium]
MAQYGGVYRGVIVNTADPDAAGRVQVRIPGVLMTTAWAPVCMAFGAPPNAAPTIGGSVMVAFEAGDAQHPVVLGSLQT